MKKRSSWVFKLFLVICFTMAGAAVFVLAAEPGAFFANGPRNKKEMALTFDDGPGNYTAQVLAVLKKYNVKATFFMEGDQVEIRSKIAKMVLDDGHEIGSHSYSHPNFYFYKKDDYRQQLEKEIDKSEKLIQGVTGTRPYMLRMPYGYVRAWVKEVAKEKGYYLINWTFGCDWKKMSADQLVQAYTKNIGSGAIFLMHDGGKFRQPTVDALPKIIEEIQKRGYKIVPIAEMLGLKEDQISKIKSQNDR